MINCMHTQTFESTVTRELSGYRFSGITLVCKDCGAELWDDKLNAEFSNWVLSLPFKPRVQFKMSSYAEQCLDKALTRFPGASKAVLVRAMITVYMHLLKEGSKANDIFNQIFDSKYYQAFENDNNSSMFQTDVKPILFFDIQSWAKSFDLKPNEFSLEAFHLMMALCVAEDQELKDFWNKHIFPQIETIIKAS
jgi:hypothetical protein